LNIWFSYQIGIQKIVQTVFFFQIGGGIAGDFPICVVPMLPRYGNARCTFGVISVKFQIQNSYGSYSGAVPNEKITWGKLDIKHQNLLLNPMLPL
jgi:deoxyhypusine synthase